MPELISIIVPIYNVVEYLSRCIDSLVAQTYPNIEILLVDDCSTDGSATIAKEYAEKHPSKCRYIQRENNAGAAATRNSGIYAASGQWLAFVDSDDWVDEDYIQTLYDAAVADGADAVLSGIYYYYSDNNCKDVSPFADLTNKSPKREIIALTKSYPCTRLFKKKLFLGNGILFPESLRRAEDMATIIPILTYAEKISIVRKPMYYYFQRQSSVSHQNREKVDVGFYPNAVNTMIELSAPGFETELEYRAVSELMYGMITIMLRAKYPKKSVLNHIDAFAARYPEWQKNPYLRRMEKGKRIFVRFAAKRRYAVLKMLVSAWDFKQKLQQWRK